MSVLRSMASGPGSLFRKEQVDRELDEELRGFLSRFYLMVTERSDSVMIQSRSPAFVR